MLILSFILMSTLSLLILLDHTQAQFVFKKFDDFSFAITILLLLSSYFTFLVKVGGFEKRKAIIVWLSYNIAAIAVLAMVFVLFVMAFEAKWLLDAVVPS